MADRASAERACKEPNPIIDGRKANVNLAILGAKPRGNVPAGKRFFFILVLSFSCHFLFMCFKNKLLNASESEQATLWWAL